MGAQSGKDLLIKIDMTGDGMFETLAGLRASRIAFNAESVDVTVPGKPGRLARAAVRRRGALGVDLGLGGLQGRDQRRAGAAAVL